MRISILLILCVNIAVSAQTDTNFVQSYVKDNTFQFHTTFKDFAIIGSQNGSATTLFRNHNWSTGFYFKWGKAELFMGLPHTSFSDLTIGSSKSLGTGFNINVFLQKFHFHYDFKYVQGYESISALREDGLKTLSNNNFFFFNRFNSFFIENDQRYSLRAALRFNERQLTSAGSWIVGLPVSFYRSRITDIYDDKYARFVRLSLWPQGGYGYNYVSGRWSLSALLRSGLEIRYAPHRSRSSIIAIPHYNLTLASSYHWEEHFIGLRLEHSPEFDYNDGSALEIRSLKFRIYVGRRY